MGAYDVRARTYVYCGPIPARAIAHVRGGVGANLVDVHAHANDGWRAIILKARARRFLPGGGASTGPGPAIPAGVC